MKEIARLKLPHTVRVGSKDHAVNLNHYRNLKGVVNGNVKKAYKKIVDPQIALMPLIDQPVKVVFEVTMGNRKADLDNLMIHSKYLLDAISKNEIWEDDNFEIVKEVSIKLVGRAKKTSTEAVFYEL